MGKSNNKGISNKNHIKKIAKPTSKKAKIKHQTLFSHLVINDDSFNNKPQEIIAEQQDIRQNSAQPQFIAQWKLNDQKYLYVCHINKYYEVRGGQQNEIEIRPIFENEKIIVNGDIVQQLIINSYTVFGFAQSPKSPRNLKQIIELYSDSLTEEDRKNFLLVNFNEKTLLLVNRQIKLKECVDPWVGLPDCALNQSTLMIIGVKNSGKSTLASYIQNVRTRQNIALLDCDIGRNMHMEGCVTFCAGGEIKKLWIGQLSPLNNLDIYLKSIKYFYDHYQRHHYFKKLVVNTMGYLSGLGEILLYQIFNIIKPPQVLVLQADEGESGKKDISQIEKTLLSQQYASRLHISGSQDITKSCCKIYHYRNKHCTTKQTAYRFKGILKNEENKKFENIDELLTSIHRVKYMSSEQMEKSFLKRMKKGEINLYEENKYGGGQVKYRKIQNQQCLDMRIVIIADRIKQDSTQNIQGDQVNDLLEVKQLGFLYNDLIVYNKEIVIKQTTIGILREGIDFDKSFYNINEYRLIELELLWGRIKHVLVNSSRALGSKGVRNNPAKQI